MRKIITLCIWVLSVQAFSQSFYKGALIFDANVGIDAYAVKYHYQLKNTNQAKDQTSGAVSSNFNLGLEYGLSKWFGIGLRAKLDKFVTRKDSVTNTTPAANGGELALILNAHVVHTNHFDLPIGIDFGYSHLNYYQNDIGNNQIYGNGSYFNLHINPRIYIKRFGFNFNVAIPFIHYSNMTSNNSVFNQYVLADWKAAGFSLGFGIQYRFFTVK